MLLSLEATARNRPSGEYFKAVTWYRRGICLTSACCPSPSLRDRAIDASSTATPPSLNPTARCPTLMGLYSTTWQQQSPHQH
eukprot:3612183-Rhodomonas_salina.2